MNLFLDLNMKVFKPNGKISDFRGFYQQRDDAKGEQPPGQGVAGLVNAAGDIVSSIAVA